MRCALAIELSGAILASLSVVALFFDDIKSKVKEIQEQNENALRQSNTIVLGRMNRCNVVKSILSCIFLEPIRLILSLLREGVFFVRININIGRYEKMINNIENMGVDNDEISGFLFNTGKSLESAKGLRENILYNWKCRCKVIQAGWSMLKYLLIGDLVMILEHIAKVLAGRQTIIKIFIAIGTLLVIIGISLELKITP